MRSWHKFTYIKGDIGINHLDKAYKLLYIADSETKNLSGKPNTDKISKEAASN